MVQPGSGRVPGTVGGAGRHALSALFLVLVSLLALCVAGELTLGFKAYSELLASQAPNVQSMVAHQGVARLWENGFGGHLPRLLDPTHVAGYAVILTAGMVVIATAQAIQDRRGGQRSTGQPITPGSVFGTAAARLAAASDRIEESVTALTTAVGRLGEEVGGRIAGAASGLAAAGGNFADHIETSGVQAARDIGAVYTEAVAYAAADLTEAMTTVNAQLVSAVGDVRTAAERIGASGESITAAVSRLSELLAEDRRARGGDRVIDSTETLTEGP